MARCEHQLMQSCLDTRHNLSVHVGIVAALRCAAAFALDSKLMHVNTCERPSQPR
jgi:hypothetical protein